MTHFSNFHALFPQTGLLQRPYFTGGHANLAGRQRHILTLARHQRIRRTDLSSTNGNTLSNSRPSGTLLGTRRQDLQQQPGNENIGNGSYSSSKKGSSTAPAPASIPAAATPSSSRPRSKIKLDPSAHDISWDACTVRGFEDGSLVFKFDQLDPRIEEELSILLSSSDDTASSTASTGTSFSSTSTTTSTRGSFGTKATLANFAWSSAVKLGVKFPNQLEITLRKLEDYVTEFDGKTAPARTELKHSLFKTYEKAVKRQEKFMINEGIVSGIEDMMLKEKEERVDEEENHHRESVSTTATIAVEELKRPIRKNENMITHEAIFQPPQVEESSEKEEVTTLDDNDSNGDGTLPSSLSSSDFNIFKAFYRTLVITPLRFILSTVLSIITWAVHLPLALYRTLPYGFRKLFHSSWPPKLPNTRHVSSSINRLFSDESGINRSSLADAGFDAQGRCAPPLIPLADVPAWKIEQLVGCGISNANLYRSALTHPTVLPPESRALSYERLEYLGDAVMELCTRQLLMERAPDADEGVLTNQGQFLVSGSTVNKYGAWLGLDKWVLCNAYSMRDGLISSPHMLGDAFEALLAAVYVDRGLEAARKLLMRVYTQCPSVEWDKIGFMRDHKGELMKAAHQRRVPLPTYHVVDARYKNDPTSNGDGNGNGPVVKKRYWTVEVEFDGEVIGLASHFEKREAEREAAKAGLVFLGEVKESISEGEE